MKLHFRLAASLLLATTALAPLAAADMPDDANTTCPVMQKEQAKPDLYVEHKGRKIYVCCVKCKKRFAKDPDKYMARIQAQDKATSESRKAAQAGK